MNDPRQTGLWPTTVWGEPRAPAGQVADSVSVLFSRALAAEVLRSSTLRAERLLDVPEDADAAPPLFVERAYTLDSTTALLLDTLARDRVSTAHDEAFHALLERNPHLLDTALPQRHYTPETLSSPEAKRALVPPDRAPLP